MANDDHHVLSGRRKAIVLGMVAALGLVGFLGIVWSILSDPGTRSAAPSRIGGPFRLQSSAGGTLDSSTLLGKPFLLTFGFTRCPSTCPTTLAEMTSLIDMLQAEGRSIDGYFVTIDPERDTVASMREYLTSFSDRITGLTGSVAEIEQVERSYRAFVQKVPTGSGDYTFDHTASVYLMDAKGRFVVPLDLDNKFDRGVAEIRRVLSQEPPTASIGVTETQRLR
ncbi:SCO family protein [Methylobacterium sp. WCS2018Hpa-22]|uniref:SCO family protein n=1 Tax=Methylobacterium sp. WCS2018Hpa-22 TaxID=3073633 RepID=UPI002889285F|nr:SCO family protein [Methylobacterium sp. WCS2018Hpa-22]